MPRRVLLALVVAAAAATSAQPAAAATPLRLLHDSFDPSYRSPFGAVPTATRVRLSLRVTGGRAKAAALRVDAGDPATDSVTRATVRMRRRGTLWSATIRTPAQPRILSYSFRVTTKAGTFWYGDDYGDDRDDVRQGGTGRQSRFEGQGFQLTVYDRGFTTPAWLQGAFVYQIFVDRFRNGDATNDYCRSGSSAGCPTFYGDVPPKLHGAWNEPVEDPRATGVFNRDFFGGDLEGVTEKLDYLKALGVDAIWLTPIFKARSNHRYDTDDYLQVDAGVGGDAAFDALVAAARARGIRLILDGVFNHTSSDSVYFDRYHRYAAAGACESTASPFRSWFDFTTPNVPCGGSDYSSFFQIDTLPQLENGNAAVRDFLYRGPDSVVRHWDTRGADGWRLDAADSIEHDWWRDFRRTVKGYAPDGPLVGEMFPDATPFLLGNELDGVMNYRFRRAVDGFARITSWTDSTGNVPVLTPSALDHALKAMREDYPPQALASSFELVDSHDTNRARFVLTESGDSPDVAKQRQRLVALLQFTSPGAPMVYYGDEAGIDAPGQGPNGDPYNRAPFPWPDASGDPDVYGPVDESMVAYYTRLAAIRHAHAALRGAAVATLLTGNTTGSATDNGVYAFLRRNGSDAVLVAVNKGGGTATARIPVRGAFANGATLTDQLGGAGATVAGGSIQLTLPPRGGAILAAG